MASTSRGSIGAPTHRGGGSEGNLSTISVPESEPSADTSNRRASTYRGGGRAGNVRNNSVPDSEPSGDTSNRRAQVNRGTAESVPKVLALREGDPLPVGYKYVVRDHVQPSTTMNSTDTVDLTTPPDDPPHTTGEDVEEAKQRAATKRNANRSTNKQVNKSFAKEMKDSLAEGRAPEINAIEDQPHLKARWHSIAKEAAYKILDLSKEGWKAYTFHEKRLVHNEIIDNHKFDPPLDPARIDKYLSAHLRSARAVWKAHWIKYGDEDRHPNCPETAWAKLILWWPTEKCMEESADMAGRRSRVQKGSRTGRKKLVDRMDEEVSFPILEPSPHWVGVNIFVSIG